MRAAQRRLLHDICYGATASCALASLTYALYLVSFCYVLRTRPRTNQNRIWYEAVRETETWYYPLVNNTTSPTIWPALVATRLNIPLACLFTSIVLCVEVIATCLLRTTIVATMTLMTSSWFLHVLLIMIHIIQLPMSHLRHIDGQSTLIIVELIAIVLYKALVCITLGISCMYEPQDGPRRKYGVSEIGLPGCIRAKGISHLDLMLTVVCACATCLFSVSIAASNPSNSLLHVLFCGVSTLPPFIVNSYAVVSLSYAYSRQKIDDSWQYLLWSLLCIFGAAWAMLRNHIMNVETNSWSSVVGIVAALTFIVKIFLVCAALWVLYTTRQEYKVSCAQNGVKSHADNNIVQSVNGNGALRERVKIVAEDVL